jgi:hypothetical protein
VSERPQVTMQNSFSSGELSPTLYGRVDLDKYHTGLQTCRNAFVDYRGGITRRPGTRYVTVMSDNTKPHRLIPFIFSTVQAYVLVFGHMNMRVVRNGGLVTEPTIAVGHSGTTVTATAHGYSTGDWVAVTDSIHPRRVNVIDANSFTLIDIFTNGTITSTSATTARVFTLATPWATADLPLLKFTQSFDTMTIVHPNYQPQNLTRTQHWVWTLTPVTIGAKLVNPVIATFTTFLSGSPPAGTSSDTAYGFMVTAVNADGDESAPSPIFGNFGLNMETLPVTARITWGAVAGAARYNIYAATVTHGIAMDDYAPMGFIGSVDAATLTFKDTDLLPDFTKAPPTHDNPFASSNWPGVVTYFDQRKVYAASLADPQTMWMSKVDQFDNFDVSKPANDGDALTLALSSNQSAKIRALLPMPDGMLVFTQAGTYKVSGGGTNTGIKVSSAIARAQNYIGAGDLPPIPVNFEIFFVQEKGSIVRVLTYNFYTSTYEPADLTLLSNHLFLPHTIKDWAYAEHPYKLVWCVRDDGQLLCLTYLKDQKIQGWTRHDTNGQYESIVSIPENGTDGVYAIVNRTINGGLVRTLEQFQSKDLSQGVEFAWYLDCALDYGSTFPAADVSFTSTFGSVTVTASASVFGSGDVGKVIRAGGGMLTISTFSSGTVVSGTWNRSPTDLIQAPTPYVRLQVSGTWTMAAKVTLLSGLDFLKNMPVSYLADGVPGTGTVSSTGTLTLPIAASKVIVGLNFVTQCQTLALEPSSGQSLQGKRKRIVSVIAKVQDTGVLNWGPSFTEMTPWIDVYGTKLVNGVMTGDQPLGVDQFYSEGGRVCWQQSLPMPMTILSLVPELSVGD